MHLSKGASNTLKQNGEICSLGVTICHYGLVANGSEEPGHTVRRATWLEVTRVKIKTGGETVIRTQSSQGSPEDGRDAKMEAANSLFRGVSDPWKEKTGCMAKD